MVFTRPPADDAFRQAMLQPKKYAKTKRGKAEKERDRILAMTPEERVKHIQAQERKNAEELRERQERQARWDREQRKMNEERLQREAEEKARQERLAEIERRAGIRWPGHVVPPEWLAAYDAAHPRQAAVVSQSFDSLLSKAIDATLHPLFKSDPIVESVHCDDGQSIIKNTPQREMAETITQLIQDVLEIAEQQLCTGEGATAREFTFDRDRFWKELAGTTAVKRHLDLLRGAYASAVDDGPLFDESTLSDLRASAYYAHQEDLNLMELFEEANVARQDEFIAELIDCGALSRHDVGA